jgi:hypothetical protein
MADLRTKACEDIFHACRDLYDLYDDDSRTKCLQPNAAQSKNCDQFVFGGLHKGFRRLHLLTQDDEDRPPSLSVPAIIISQVKEFINGLVSKQTGAITYGGSYHSTCITFNKILSKLDTALCSTGPLKLQDFETKPTKSRLTWKAMLARGSLGKPSSQEKEEESDSVPGVE